MFTEALDYGFQGVKLLPESITVRVRVDAQCFRIPMLAMDFALVPDKAAEVCEIEILLAAALFADVGTIVLVHVSSSMCPHPCVFKPQPAGFF